MTLPFSLPKSVGALAAAGAILAGCAPMGRTGSAAPGAASAPMGVADWPSYNGSLASQRYSAVSALDPGNVSALKQVCAYDLGANDLSFQTGPVVVGRTLYGTSERDTFAIDAMTCSEKWRVREQLPETFLKVNRGVAFLDGRVYRGLNDGNVVAYDAATGRRLWATRIADPKNGESLPAAPIAWNGIVFLGVAGGDNYAVKGRVHGIDAATGRILWQTYTVPREEDRGSPGSQMASIAVPTWGNPANVPIGGGGTWSSYTLDADRGLLYVPAGNPAPDFVRSLRPGANLFANSILVLDARTGAYRTHYSVVPHDFHDWDVSATPTLLTTRGGQRLMAIAAKDGQLHVYDLASARKLHEVATTTRENTTAPLTREGTRFCPGSQGGSEWNGAAYSPQTNLIYAGTVDWCTTVQTADPAKLASMKPGESWAGTPDGSFGKMDPKERWAGWVTATDADSGAVRWRFKADAPVLAAVTPTAGGVVFTADMDANAYALDAATGRQLWRAKLAGVAGGGVVTYAVDGQQYVAFAAGNNSPIWPNDKQSAKIVIFGR